MEQQDYLARLDKALKEVNAPIRYVGPSIPKLIWLVIVELFRTLRRNV